MTRKKIYLVSILLLAATVPWFFVRERHFHILGFPPWAFYSLCMTVLYAAGSCFLIGRFWSLLSDDGEEGGGS